ncbi:hypothetical protein Back11_50890 [Paenibacillus baekrokdamisoli]|uniref:Uncharacterized protein n=1 Tax=Paenibacillus baekrokdamisoli TaxID=1712516 RepID=A0A3G9JLG9_9BACL|nr:DUF2252 family protein [Paenibacillus baekrokdamisoli]MBB3068921.1 uncharacterized protein (DUF2252 family) [Paenibacillus baekrokdamisoli]BBH23744.1 hypothetical protein Back11_50890 [Paenibacillus baekrokdamisoli]
MLRTLRRFKRQLALTLAFTIAALPVVPTLSYADAGTSQTGGRAAHVVISEIFGGGNEKFDSLFQNDFVELYNPTSSNVSVAGWSIQYAPSNSLDNAAWTVVPLGTPTAEIPAYGYYLVKLGGKSAQNPPLTALPAADAVGTVDIDNKGGKIALVAGTTALASKDPLSDIEPNKSLVIDFVGMGLAGSTGANAFQGSLAPEMSAKKSIERKWTNPLNPIPAEGLDAKLAANRGKGNDWDSHNNGADFTIVSTGSDGYPQNSTFITSFGLADAANSSAAMSSPTAVAAGDNSFTVNLFNGTVAPDTTLSVSDYAVTGLQGLDVTAASSADGHAVTFTVSGTASSSVTVDQNLQVVLQPSVWTMTNKPLNPVTITGLQLKAYSAKVSGAACVGGSTLAMLTSTKLDPAHSNLCLKLTTGTPTEGTIDPSLYAIQGLPSAAQVTTAVGNAADKTIMFTIAGDAIQPVTTDIPLTVTVKVGAVSEGATQDSDVITGFTWSAYQKPVIADAARKASLTNIIKESNAFFSDASIKASKYTKQGANLFDFYRGTPNMFFSDLGTVIPVPASWKAWPLKTWIQGDAHLQNIGTYNNANDQTVFDLNDPDSSYVAPFYWDLLRLLPSIYLERDVSKVSAIHNLTDAQVAELLGDFLDEYRATVNSVAGNNDENTRELNAASLLTGEYTSKMLSYFAAITTDTQLSKASAIVDGTGRKFKTDSKYGVLSDSERAAFLKAWPAYVSSLGSVGQNNQLLNKDYYTIKDVVYRLGQGNSSLGSIRYNLIIEGSSSAANDDVILDAKEQFEPSMFVMNEVDKSSYTTWFGGNDAARTVTAYRAMTNNTDSFAGVLNIGARNFVVRAIAKSKGDYTDEKPAFASKDDLANYMKYAAQAYALAHARSDSDFDSKYVSGSFDDQFKAIMDAGTTWASFKQSLVELSGDYYRQVASDFNLMKSDLTAGTLIDVNQLTGLTYNGGTSVAGFASDQLVYNQTVENNAAQSVIRAAAADSLAKVTIAGVTATSINEQTVALKVGTNTINIIVEARDGSQKTYKLSLTRKSSSGSDSGNGPGSGSGGTGSETGTGTGTGTKNLYEETSVTGKGGSSTSVLTLNGEQLKLEASKQTPSGTKQIVIKPEGAANQAVQLKVPAEGFNQLGANLIVEAKGFTLTLPSISVNMAAAAKKLGTTIDHVELNIEVTPTTTGVAVQISAAANGKTVQVSSEPASGISISLPYKGDGVQNGNGASVVRLLPNGAYGFVPAIFTASAVVLTVKASGEFKVVQSKVSFNDLSKSWAKTDIELLASKFVVSGVDGNNFKPDQTISRAEFTALLVKALMPEQLAASGNVGTMYNDVKQNDWFAPYIQAAAACGLVAGTGDGQFNPSSEITREQMAIMLQRALAVIGKPLDAAKGNETNTFKDGGVVSQWAVSAVNGALSTGLMQGLSNRTFAPQEEATRAQAAVIIKRALQFAGFLA